MGKYSIPPREAVWVDGRAYRVVRRSANQNLILEDVQTREPLSLSDEQIETLFAEGRLVRTGVDSDLPEGFDPHLADFTELPENLRSEAHRRLPYVRAVAERGLPRSQQKLIPLIREVAQQTGDLKPPSPATLCRWLKFWDASGAREIRALVPGYHARGNRTKRLHHKVHELIDEMIEEVYLRPERPTARSVYNAVVAQLDDWNQLLPRRDRLCFPSERSITRRIAAWNRYEVMRGRHGRRAADQEFRPVGRGPESLRPLEVVEMDHTLTSFFVVRNGVLLGRPWLTVALDRYSRAPVGVYFGFEPPSAASVGMCLRNAILPKSGIDGWPCSGVPETVVVDNAREFHSKAFTDACAQLGITIQYCPVRSPRYKGKIERWLGTFEKSVAQQMPGTTFANVVERGDYDSEKHAVIDFDRMVDALYHWISQIYLRQLHRGINDTPYNRWQTGIKEYPVSLPKRVEDLDPLLGGFAERVVSRRGIELLGLQYNSDEIFGIRSRANCPKKVKVRYDPLDLGEIRVFDPEIERHIRIPCTEPDYASRLTLAEHTAICRRAKQQMEGYVDFVALCRAKDELRREGQRAAAKGRIGPQAARRQRVGTADFGEAAIKRASEHEDPPGSLEAPDSQLQESVASPLPEPIREPSGEVRGRRPKKRKKERGAGAPDDRQAIAPDPGPDETDDTEFDPEAGQFEIVPRTWRDRAGGGQNGN